MRVVNVYKWMPAINEDGTRKKNEKGAMYCEKVVDYKGLFHKFSVASDSEGTFASAIVENDNGFLENIDVGLVQFVEPTKQMA